MSATLCIAAAVWPSSRPGFAPGASDPLASLGAEQAHLTGVDLVKRGLASSSLPYFRHALGLAPSFWEIHCNYAAALLNAVGEARSSLAVAQSVTRSSWERAAMIHEALAEFDRAESLAPTSGDQAWVIGLRAQGLAVWGLSWDGLAEYTRAKRLDPSSEELRGRRAQLGRIMRDPRWSSE